MGCARVLVAHNPTTARSNKPHAVYHTQHVAYLNNKLSMGSLLKAYCLYGVGRNIDITLYCNRY